jgi:hypothetical protein
MDALIPKVLLPQEAGAVEAKTGGPASEPANSQEVFRLFDQRDERQITDALKGQFLDEFVYSFCRRHKSVDGKRPPECQCTDVIVGLSWLGVQEAAREYRGIHVPLEKMRKVETDDSVEVTLEAIDTKTDSSRIGVACQSKKMRLSGGQVMDDAFCVAKAVAKAQRNAIRPLLPVTLIKAWIEAHRNHGTQPALTNATQQQKPAALPAPHATSPDRTPPPPAAIPNETKQSPAPVSKGYSWFPSVGQVKRIFGLAHGHQVSREQIAELLKTICGVEDPSKISSRAKYEALCSTIETGTPF